MRISNNLSALTAFNSLNRVNNQLNKTIQQLSTGLRINSAADDAAGFAISEKMRSQISGLDRALQNSQDGISLLQTAEGALEQTNSMLQRMRELSLQASNDSLTSQDRQYIQLEIDQLKDQIDRIANTTQFNQKRILDGSSGALWASSDTNVRARVKGGLTHTDQFGQKVSSEGNYRIEVKADPGEAQVQKSNLMCVAESGIEVEMRKLTEPIVETVYEVETITETVTETVTQLVRTPELVTITTTEEIPHIIRLNDGLDSSNATSGDGWAFQNGSLVITGSGVYDIRGTGASSSTNIIVKSGAEAQIFLTDVNIDMTSSGRAAAAFQIEEGGGAEIFLANTNTLRSSAGRAGLEVPDGARLRISSAKGDGHNDGRLEAFAGANGGAGIGGFDSGIKSTSKGRAGYIQIDGGTVEATGVRGSAGIGGANTYGSDGGGHIVIMGGNVTAWGASGGAGIGSGFCAAPTPSHHAEPTTSDGTVIEIYGGVVKAYGGSASAGIGGAEYSSGGTIIINKRLIDEEKVTAVSGGNGAERIGRGRLGKTEDNDINCEADVEIEYEDVPDRPKITVEHTTTETRYVYKEIEVEEEREITREVTKKVDKVVGERVLEEFPVVKGLDGDFVFHEKKLSEISQFYNVSGVSLVSQPQNIKITQGDGKTTSVTLYETDTMYEVAKKINDAIANSLGQGKYTDNINKFCTIADGTEGTSEAVFVKEPIYAPAGYLSEYGFDIPEGTLIGYKVTSTMLVRSGIPGKAGELSFSGDQDLLNALGLNTIQESSETRYTASLYDAHSGKVISSGAKVTGNVINDALTGVDIEFDAMAGIKSSWDENTKRYVLSGGEKCTATIHLKDNGITFQTGANKGEDFSIQLGDMSSKALGISGVNVTTRESAASSVGVIDMAINRVSAQRAKIGSYQNALEHTMESLTVTSMNLTSADSRIRDADMSKVMMKFVKLQILNQSGTSMLAQANQLPQSVLSLIQ